VRTRGTSPRKNSAKIPAETPKPVAIEPYRKALGADRPQKLGMCFVLVGSLLVRCFSAQWTGFLVADAGGSAGLLWARLTLDRRGTRRSGMWVEDRSFVEVFGRGQIGRVLGSSTVGCG
jgi:hypothetical protein